MTAGPVSARLAALCDQLGPRVGPASGAALAQVRRRLAEPLRVAVAGRLKAGKSTLVNALIGRRVAPTAAGECTRVVTQFRHGPIDRVEVVGRDGGHARLPLDEAGMIPQQLGLPWAEIAFVDVTLATDRLQDLIVVDTPGLSSTDPETSARAHGYLTGGPTVLPADLDRDSADALHQAEAIVYVFSQAVRADDLAALAAFQAASAQLGSSPVNSLGILNKIDTLTTGPADPWPVADALAAEQASVLRRVVAEVVPMVALLAETTEAGRLTAAGSAALRSLAALPAAEQQVLLASADLFSSRPAPVPAGQRTDLLSLLASYGVRRALAALTARPELSTAELVGMLAGASGLTRVRHTLDRVFRSRTDAIKSGRALAALTGIASRADRLADRELLHGAIEAVWRAPECHQLRLLEVAQRLAAGTVALPEPMTQFATRLAVSDDPAQILQLPEASAAQLTETAIAAAAQWRAYAVADASPAQARVAMVVHRGLQLLAQRLRAGQ